MKNKTPRGADAASLPTPGGTADDAVIYVVDDDLSVRESLGNLMRSVGLSVQLFASALEFRRFNRPPGRACLVLDVRLPGMSGLDLQTELGTLGDGIPIIFITGHGDVPMSVRAMKGGALEFLQKPLREQDLLDAIHAALSRFDGLNPAAARGTAPAVPVTTPPPGAAARGAAADLSPRQALAKNIQLARAIFNWSQEELGSQCDLHRSHISALERAELSVGVDAIDSLAAAFRIPSHVMLMQPGEAQTVLLESFNGIAPGGRDARRSR